MRILAKPILLSMPSFDDISNEAYKLRNTYWQQIGDVAPDVVSHLINPAFMGGPAWPALRQAFIKVTTPNSVILASDGLSDPYSDIETNPDNAGYNGLGLEMYVESTDKLTEFNEITQSWQFDILYQVSQLAAQNGNLIGMLGNYEFITTEIYAQKLPASYLNAEGRAGVMLGLKASNRANQLQGNLEVIQIVNIKLLTIKELDFVLEKKQEGRIKLAELFYEQGQVTFSSLGRISVI